MLPIFIGALAAAAGPVLGSIGGALIAKEGQKDTNRANVAMSREQMEFQAKEAEIARAYNTDEANTARDFMERMSDTSYQRAMRDMKTAGLNPILAYSQGGASTPMSPSPSSPMGQGSMPVLKNPNESFGGNMIGTAMAQGSTLLTDDENRDRIKEQVKVLGEQANLTNAQIHKVQTEMDKIRKETMKIQAETAGVEADNVQRQVIADFLDSAEVAGIAKYIGISPSLFKGFVRTIFLGGKRK